MKRRNRVRERARRSSKPQRESRALEHPPLDTTYEDLSRKTYLSVAELVTYLSFPTPNAAHHWLIRTRYADGRPRVPKLYVGRRLVVARRDVDAAIQTENRKLRRVS